MSRATVTAPAGAAPSTSWSACSPDGATSVTAERGDDEIVGVSAACCPAGVRCRAAKLSLCHGGLVVVDPGYRGPMVRASHCAPRSSAGLLFGFFARAVAGDRHLD